MYTYFIWWVWFCRTHCRETVFGQGYIETHTYIWFRIAPIYLTLDQPDIVNHHHHYHQHHHHHHHSFQLLALVLQQRSFWRNFQPCEAPPSLWIISAIITIRAWKIEKTPVEIFLKIAIVYIPSLNAVCLLPCQIQAKIVINDICKAKPFKVLWHL